MNKKNIILTKSFDFSIHIEDEYTSSLLDEITEIIKIITSIVKTSKESE